MLTRDETRSAFIEVIMPYVKSADPTAITDQSSFIEDLHANSARMVDIVLETEDRFHIRIDDKEADSLRTVGDAVDIILGKVS